MAKRHRNAVLETAASEDGESDGSAAGNEEPARKRQRTHEPRIDALPPEIRHMIIRYLVDGLNLQKSIKDIERLRQASSMYNKDVTSIIPGTKSRDTLSPSAEEVQRTNPTLQRVGRLFGEGRKHLETLPIENTSFSRKQLALENNLFECDILPIIDKAEKSDLVRRVLKSDNVLEKYEAFNSLALNIAYLEPMDQSDLVSSICERHKYLIDEDGYSAGLTSIKTLIEKANYLTVSDQNKLLDAALLTIEANARAQILDACARKIPTLEVKQEEIFNEILGDTNTGGYRLGLLVQNLDKLSAVNRERTANAILGLPNESGGRLWAMSKLVEKRKLLLSETRRQVETTATKALENSITEKFDKYDNPWYMRPSICQNEIAHHLSTDLSTLTPTESDCVFTFIKKVKSPRSRAQLLIHLSLEQRTSLFRQLHVYGNKESTVQASLIAQGLTFRIEHLNDAEKSTYAHFLSNKKFVMENALTYNFRNNLSSYKPDSANDLIKKMLDLCRARHLDNLEVPVEIFSHVAGQSQVVNNANLKKIVDTAGFLIKRSLERRSEKPEEHAALRSLTLFTAQSLAGAGRAILVDGMPGLADYLAGQEARRGYDDRVRDVLSR